MAVFLECTPICQQNSTENGSRVMHFMGDAWWSNLFHEWSQYLKETLLEIIHV